MNYKRASWMNFVAAVLVLLSAPAAGVAQEYGQSSSPWSAASTDQQNPQLWEYPSIEGLDGLRGQSYYYWLTAGPGAVNVTLDLMTDTQMANLRLIFRDEQQHQLLNFTNIGTTSGTTKTQSFHLSGRSKVYVQLMFPLTAGVKLNYKVRLAGAVQMKDPLANMPVKPAMGTQMPAATTNTQASP